MFASPAKRRKTSPTTSVAVDASNVQSNPSTPKRASFQSPTKASLARSHPNLLPQSAGQSQVRTRGQGLRQELLSRTTSQSVSRPPTAGPQTPKQKNQPVGNKPVSAAAKDAESFSGAIRSLFTAASSRTPLRARQPPIRLVESRDIDDDLQISKQDQAKHPRGRPRSNKDGANDEPELPPTPVQLGLNSQPDRPRGLSSSSPGRSSGSNRQRTRLNESRHTSSPSKLRVQAQTVVNSINSAPSPPLPPAASAEEIPDEAQESDAEAPAEEEEEPLVPEAVLQKRSLRDSLSAQLARLQSDLASLETALLDSGKDNSNSGDTSPSLLALLTTANPSCAEVTSEHDYHLSPSPTVPNPTALGSKPLPYLTLFAPGNLQLHSTISTSAINGKAHQIHALELLAPEPWPAHIFGARIKVTVDVEEKQVRDVEVVKMRPEMGHQGLREWVEKRLEVGNGLHRYDVGGLVWGIGRWWEECVKRAEEWKKLEGRLNNKSSKKRKDAQEDAQVVREEDVKTLLPHLARTSMEFELGVSKRITRSKKSPGEPKQELTKVMLLWDLLLDWTGEADATVGVAVTGMGDRGEKGIKDAFGMIFKRDGVFTAMEGVLSVLAKGTGKNSG